jgi:hypothetical protein
MLAINDTIASRVKTRRAARRSSTADMMALADALHKARRVVAAIAQQYEFEKMREAERIRQERAFWGVPFELLD